MNIGQLTIYSEIVDISSYNDDIAEIKSNVNYNTKTVFDNQAPAGLITATGLWNLNSSGYKYLIFSVNPGSIVRIKANATRSTQYACLANYETPKHGDAVQFSNDS